MGLGGDGLQRSSSHNRSYYWGNRLWKRQFNWSFSRNYLSSCWCCFRPRILQQKGQLSSFLCSTIQHQKQHKHRWQNRLRPSCSSTYLKVPWSWPFLRLAPIRKFLRTHHIKSLWTFRRSTMQISFEFVRRWWLKDRHERKITSYAIISPSWSRV